MFFFIKGVIARLFIVVLAIFAFLSIGLAGEEQRKPPAARTSGTLGPQVMRAVSEIQEMMSPEDEEDEPDLLGAKEALDELYERRYERMNDFEKSTVLSFFTNYYLTIEDYAGALGIFEEILTIETLREDTRLRTLRSLGQLYAAEENWDNSIRYYQEWRDLSLVEDDLVFRGLSYAYYQLEQYPESLPLWLSYMDIVLTEGEELGRDDYAYLNGLYFTLEDFESALDLTKTMIVKFDNPTDWQNLSAIYATLEDEPRRVQSLNLYYLKGLMDDETRYLNLGQSMAGLEAPYSGAKIISEGIDREVIEADVDNVTTFAQMLLISNEVEEAVQPAAQAAELDETGNSYDTLGYIHYVMNNYELASEAFNNALEKGELSDRNDTLLFLARSELALQEFDSALEAANEAGESTDERVIKSARDFVRLIEGRRSFYTTIAQRKADAIDFYRGYPPLD